MNMGGSTFFGSFDDKVSILISTGMFSESQAKAIVTEKQNETILENHCFKIWEAEDRGQTVYRTKVPLENGRPKKIQSKTRAALEDKIIKHYAEMEKAEQKNKLTLRTLWPEWIVYKADKKSVATVKRNTVAWNKYYINSPASQKLLDTPLTQIDNVELDAYMSRMVKQYKMNPHTWADFSVIIRQMLSYAYRKRYIISNPMDFVSIDVKDDLKHENKKTAKEQIFFECDKDKIIEYAWEQYRNGRSYVQKFVPLAIVFLFYTGMRLGEVTAVRFDDIDGDILYLRNSFSKDANEVQERVKSGEYRDLSLPDEAVEVIEEIRNKRIELGLPVDEYVFATNDSLMSTYKAIYKMIRKYCAELDIDIHSTHDIRRTFVSHNARIGCPTATIMEMTGHTDIKTVEKSYLFDTEKHETKKA